MKYRKLGHTGLIVSEVALGSMQFGGKMNMGNLGQQDETRAAAACASLRKSFPPWPTSAARRRGTRSARCSGASSPVRHTAGSESRPASATGSDSHGRPLRWRSASPPKRPAVTI